MKLRDLPELLRYLLCRPTGDTGIDLIEDQGRNLIAVREHGLDGEHDTAELTTGRHLTERSQRFSRVQAHDEVGLIHTIRARLLQGRERKLEADIQEAHLRQFLTDAFTQLLRAPFTGLRKLGTARPQHGLCLCDGLLTA